MQFVNSKLAYLHVLLVLASPPGSPIFQRTRKKLRGTWRRGYTCLMRVLMIWELYSVPSSAEYNSSLHSYCNHENYRMGQVVCATMPVYYSQAGMFDILIVTVINWIGIIMG